MARSLKPLTQTLPAEVNNHIVDLIQRPADKTKFETSGNSVRVQKIFGNEIMNIEIKEYPHGREVTQSVFDRPERKANLQGTINQMASEGTKNKDIANLLDISPSYVSKLKRK